MFLNLKRKITGKDSLLRARKTEYKTSLKTLEHPHISFKFISNYSNIFL